MDNQRLRVKQGSRLVYFRIDNHKTTEEQWSSQSDDVGQEVRQKRHLDRAQAVSADGLVLLAAEDRSKSEVEQFEVYPERTFTNVFHSELHFSVPDFFEVEFVGIVAFEQRAEIGELD